MLKNNQNEFNAIMGRAAFIDCKVVEEHGPGGQEGQTDVGHPPPF
jgi:hypothetical protein